MKPFLDYLDNDKRFEMHFKQMTYSVKLTSRIRHWTEIDASSSNIEIHPHLVDLDSDVQNQTELTASNGLRRAYSQQFQMLTPLLYCMQIQLNDTEFKEENGRLVTLFPSRNITVSYYRRMLPSMWRVCVDHHTDTCTAKAMGGQIVN